MSEDIEISGVEYEMNDNPSLGTVREIQSMQMGLIRDYVDEEHLRNMDSLEDEGEIIDAIVESGGMEALQEVMWRRSMLETVQTISLACDEVFTSKDFDEMGARDFKAVKNEAEDALGGDASDFFEDLGIGTLLTEEDMNRQAAQV